MASKTSSTELLDPLLDTKGFPFFSLICKLMHYANMTHPDISAAVSLLSRHMCPCTGRHLEQAKRVPRYVSDTKDYCLTLNDTISTDLLKWQDSSFADGIVRRSRTCFTTMICQVVPSLGATNSASSV